LARLRQWWWPNVVEIFQIDFNFGEQERFTGHPDRCAPNTTGDTSRAIINPQWMRCRSSSTGVEHDATVWPHLGRSVNSLPIGFNGFMGLFTTSSATVDGCHEYFHRNTTNTTGARQAVCWLSDSARQVVRVCRFRNAKTRASSDSIGTVPTALQRVAISHRLLSIFYSYSSAQV